MGLIMIYFVDLVIFWMIFVKHTTGFGKIQMKMQPLCRGGIMDIRLPAWPTGLRSLTITLGTIHILLWYICDYKFDFNRYTVSIVKFQSSQSF